MNSIWEDNPLGRVLDRLENVRLENGHFKASCPVSDHGKGQGDRNPSLAVSEGEDGRVLLKCWAGCPYTDVLAAIDLAVADLFPENGGASHSQRGGGGYTPSVNGTYVHTLTLEEYAKAKKLKSEFLRGLGLSDFHYQGRPAVRIPYLDDGGGELCARFRLALEGDNRFRWKKGSKPTLYGLWRLNQAREAGYAVLVEGESDAQTCWYHDIPALGIPGTSNWRNEWAEQLESVEKVYVVVEPDEAAEGLWERLAASPLKERLYRVEFEGVKDASALHLDSPDTFAVRFEHALKKATAWLDIAESEAQERTRESWSQCEGLANGGSILDRFAEDLRLSGVAGEARTGKLVYLALNSRHLDAKQLVNVVVKGPSSAGKTFLVEKTLEFYPKDAYIFLTAMSERALAYTDEPLSHRFLVLAEAAGMSGEFQTYLIRSLLSEGRLKYETVEKTGDGLRPRVIEKEGPTGLVVTTTKTRLHSENETRMLTVTANDSAEHTKAIFAALADEDAVPPDLTRWRALQTWIAGGERRVSIPYAKNLAKKVPPVAVRLRRDFGAILNLIRSHALLHRARRERDDRGRVVATLEDYRVVRDLVADLISEGAGTTVPAVVRQTVEAARGLLDGSGDETLTIRAVSEELELDYQPTHRRVTMALDAGYLKNLEERKGRPARLVMGDSLPEDQPILPEPEELCESVCTYVGFPEGSGPPPPPKQNPPISTSRRLTAEEAQKVQQLVADGWVAAAARAEVLREGTGL